MGEKVRVGVFGAGHSGRKLTQEYPAPSKDFVSKTVLLSCRLMILSLASLN